MKPSYIVKIESTATDINTGKPIGENIKLEFFDFETYRAYVNNSPANYISVECTND
jgi:hypothetical protein